MNLRLSRSRGSRTDEPSSRASARTKRALTAIVAVLVVCSVLVPAVLATEGAAQATQADDAGDGDVAYEEFSEELEALAADAPEAGANAPVAGATGERNLTESERAAAEGAREGVELVQQQGVEITQRQEQAAVDGAVRAVSRQNASVDASIEQLRAAARGATHGALLQSQSANVTQLQAGVYGSAAGALSQSQSTNVTQLQAVAYGAAHGTVAQHQRVNVSQMQHAAVGASAGAAHGAGQAQRVNVTQLQEAAQGSAYGALVQNQTVRVAQIQAAAFGAGGGVDEAGESDPKKVQEASMGAAQGALVQSQQATVSQVQAAARGACKGALEQRQRVSITQIQQASMGAAQGAISQYQSASVTQIQAAATGAARGTLVQIQQVTVVQIQQAAAGAASGAAGSAAQNQVVDVRQIQAAAAGAGQGTVIQIQQINVIQIQVIAESAAGGALSQHQRASVVQIQAAARGASEGAVSLTQRQTVTVEQVQLLTERAAADTAAAAAEINIDNSVTVYNYAKGAAEDPEEPEADDELRSLFVSVEEETVFLANPNDVSVTVTITNEAGELRAVTLAAGASTTETLEPGEYTLIAETADGEGVELAGRESLTVSVGDELRSLTATVEDGTLTVENPNDVRVAVTLDRDGARTTFFVPRNWDVSRQIAPGEYTLTAETADDRRVPVNGQSEYEFSVESEPPEAIDLSVSVEDGNVTVENPGDADVTVTAAADPGENRTFEVSAGETVTEAFEPGNYTLTAETADDRQVLVNGQSEYEFSVESEPPEAIDLSVSVEDGNVTIENPGDADVTVTATDETNVSRTFGVSANETATESLEPGNYTLTGEADDREVLLNGQPEYDVSVEAEETLEPIDLSVSVEDGNVTVENPGDADVTVTATDETNESRTFGVPANATVTEAFEPGNYTLTAEADDERPVTFDGAESAEIVVEDAPEEGADRLIDSCGNVTEPGEYELTDDVVADDEGTCLRITASDVVLEGNGHAIEGTGPVEELDVGEANAGILVLEEAGETVENVTVRNVSASGWNAGVQSDLVGFGGATNVSIEDSVVRNNDAGIELRGRDATLFNVTAAENDVGVTAQEAGRSNLTNVTVENNSVGVRSLETDETRLESSVVRNNGGPGVAVNTGASAAMSNVTVTGNADSGLVVRGANAGNVTIENVTVSDNGGPEIDARDGSVTAAELRVGESATLAFDDQSVVLDPVDEDDLPALPADATAAGDGLNVTGVEGSMEMRLGFEADEETVELWRHDGVEWSSVENATVDPDAVEGAVDEDGVYAPVAVEDAPEEGAGRLIDSCGNVTEPGEYELTDDVRSDRMEPCIDVQSSDVILDGNGHAIEGPGSAAGQQPDAGAFGVFVNDSDQEVRENVTVRNVEVDGWFAGVRSGAEDVDGEPNVTVEDAVVRNSDAGIRFAGGEATLRNVTAEGNAVGLDAVEAGPISATGVTIRDNDRGVRAVDTEAMTVESSLVANNAESGVDLGSAVPTTATNVTVRDNGGPGIVAGDGTDLTLSEGAVTANGGAGVAVEDGAQARIEDANVSENAGDGVRASGDATLQNVTVDANAGLEVDARDGSATAAELRVGESATLAFDAEPISLEPVEEAELPALPANATAAGDGLNVTGVVGTVDAELDVAADEETVELWRHDGVEWSTVDADAAVTDGAVRGPLEADGVYAPVVTEDADADEDATAPPVEAPVPGEPTPEAPNGPDAPEATPNETEVVETTPGNESGPTAEPDEGDAEG